MRPGGAKGLRPGGGGVGAGSLNQPFDVRLADGGLLVADFYNHLVLSWSNVPLTHGVLADGLLEQPGFQFNYPNSGNYVPEVQAFVPTASSLFCPTGMTVHGDRLFIADYYNNRVLAFPWPLVSGSPASLVLGQAALNQGLGNGGAASPRADTLRAPASVAIGANRLFVADALNHRVLIWDSVPTTSATWATWVLGQPEFSTAVRAYGGASWRVPARAPTLSTPAPRLRR